MRYVPLQLEQKSTERGLLVFRLIPTAYAVGYCLPPLRGWSSDGGIHFTILILETADEASAAVPQPNGARPSWGMALR